MVKSADRIKKTQLTNNGKSFCCDNEKTLYIFNSVSFSSFNINRWMYMKTLEKFTNSTKTFNYAVLYVHEVDGGFSKHEIEITLSEIDFIKFILILGWKKHLLLLPNPLNDSFKYFVLTDGSKEITLHTAAILMLNHMRQNRMPMLYNFSKEYFNKFFENLFQILQFCK